MVSLLDIIGPVMVGPSSSHTAGACRIALLARTLVGGQAEHARIELHGSFAKTGAGHGTDRALAGGLLGFAPDDERLRDSLDLAADAGVDLLFEHVKLRGAHHPNTVRITAKRGELQVVLVGSSLGGGRIVLTEIDGFPVDITGEYFTLVVEAHDKPGVVAAVTGALARDQVNVASMRVSRHHKGGEAIHIYELDEPASAKGLQSIRDLASVHMVRALDRVS